MYWRAFYLFSTNEQIDYYRKWQSPNLNCTVQFRIHGYTNKYRFSVFYGQAALGREGVKVISNSANLNIYCTAC
ncbi:hypothetical protein SUGI_0426600 [Cryptomeria japonica]|nr:hypothetical protein SUGI_0426600 [Cryptomeria japonica]